MGQSESGSGGMRKTECVDHEEHKRVWIMRNTESVNHEEHRECGS